MWRIINKSVFIEHLARLKHGEEVVVLCSSLDDLGSEVLVSINVRKFYLISCSYDLTVDNAVDMHKCFLGLSH